MTVIVTAVAVAVAVTVTTITATEHPLLLMPAVPLIVPIFPVKITREAKMMGSRMPASRIVSLDCKTKLLILDT